MPRRKSGLFPRVAVLCASLAALAACGGGGGATADAGGPADGAPADLAADGGGDAAGPASVGCGPTAPAPDNAWYRGAVVYEVFVRSFRDSDGDGVGDLRGLLEKLDYLNDGDPATDDDLGVDAIWLMPITSAASYHGYDVVDYRAVDPDYGTLDDFRALVAAAEQRGIKVFLDLVLNHTSDRHPWFVEAAGDEGSAHRDWYVWSAEELDWRQPTGSGQKAWYRRGNDWYYAAFWSGMPDLNYTNPAVRQEALAISRFWLDEGVSGFRLDAVRFLVESGKDLGQRDTPETLAYWREYRQALEAGQSDAVLVGEAWTTRDKVVGYFGESDDRGLQMAFDFDLQLAMDQDFRASNGQPNDIWEAVCGVLEDYPPHAQNAPFLSNHDLTRFATRAGGDPAKMKLAAALLLTLPGTPFLYYGEEIGLPNGGTPQDEQKRLPMRWDGTAAAGFTAGTPWWDARYTDDAPTVTAQTGDPDSLLSTYRRLIRLRKAEPALSRGRTELLPPESLSSETLLAYLRADPLTGPEGDADAATLLVVHNFGDAPLDGATINLEGLLLAPKNPNRLQTLWGESTATAQGQQLTLDHLPPRSTTVVRP